MQNEEEQKDPKEALRAYVIDSKVYAFVTRYKPCYDEFEADETFTDSTLRKWFNAYRCSMGDPLVLYLEDLQKQGFRMVASDVLKEPVLPVKVVG